MARGQHRRATARRRAELEATLADESARRPSRLPVPVPDRLPAVWTEERRRTRDRSTGIRWLLAAALVLLLTSGGALALERSRTGCGGGTTTVTVATAPDEYPVVRSMANLWASDGHLVDGKCVHVQVTRQPARAVATALATTWNEKAYGARPDVWMPDSSLWVRVAAEQPDAQSALGDSEAGSGTLGVVASSPILMAAPKAMAQALGWPARAVSWTSLVNARLSGQTWAKFGHPEWGQLRLGLPDPTRSTAALISLLPVIDQDGDGKISASEQLGALLLSRAVTDEAPATGAFLVRAGQAGTDPVALGAVPLFPDTEQDIIGYDQGGPQTPLVGVVPAEGSVLAEYPYVVLGGSWVTNVVRDAAAAFYVYLRGPSAQAAYRAAGFRSADGTATGLGDQVGAMPSTPASTRTLPSAATIIQAITLWKRVERRANLLGAIDTSGSMASAAGDGQTRMQVLQSAALRAITLFRYDSSVGLWQFSTNLEGSQDYREIVPSGPVGGRLPDGTPRRVAIQHAVLGLRPGGATGLYDTVLAAYSQLSAHWQPGELNIVVVMTDGKNEDAHGISQAELLRSLRKIRRPDRPVQLIAIGYGPEVDQNELRTITSAVGGRAYQATTAADMDRVFLAALLSS